jgi:hypothetical protein
MKSSRNQPVPCSAKIDPPDGPQTVLTTVEDRLIFLVTLSGDLCSVAEKVNGLIFGEDTKDDENTPSGIGWMSSNMQRMELIQYHLEKTREVLRRII